MKKCPICENEIADDAKFCPDCGNRFDNGVSNPASKQKAPSKNTTIAKQKKEHNKKVILIVVCVLVGVLLFNTVMTLAMQARYVDEVYEDEYVGYSFWKDNTLKINRMSVKIDNAGTYSNLDYNKKIIFWDWIGKTIYLKNGGKVKLSDGKAKYYMSFDDKSPTIYE